MRKQKSRLIIASSPLKVSRASKAKRKPLMVDAVNLPSRAVQAPKQVRKVKKPVPVPSKEKEIPTRITGALERSWPPKSSLPPKGTTTASKIPHVPSAKDEAAGGATVAPLPPSSGRTVTPLPLPEEPVLEPIELPELPELSIAPSAAAQTVKNGSTAAVLIAVIAAYLVLRR